MDCPNCSDPMVVLEIEQVELDHCLSCGGVWLDAGELEMSGRMPVNASGGVVSTNSIGTSALNRVTEAALQIMGQAGEHQVEKEVHKALAHGWGGLMQFVTITILGDEPKKA